MSEQLSFAGFDATPQPVDRLFFAILPDADAAASIATRAQHLRRECGLKGKPLETGRFHITLHHLGDYVGLPPDVVAAAGEAAAAVAMPPFEVTFDRAMSFLGRPRNRPFVLRAGEGVVALKAFRQAVGLAMRQAGLGRWAGSHYTPHVTLLYDARLVAERAVETVGWTVREFVLVHSLIGRTVHVPLGRWPLCG